jgi:DNA-binding transcriptional ArsR family regulator
MFGCRPENETLIPGEVVPETMLKGLQALGDSTRLRILKYLAGQPLTPTELAVRLRLRAPTVVHHLNLLRLAGLVVVELYPQGERRYALRRAGLEGLTDTLAYFLRDGGDAAQGEIIQE